jgi:pyruvate/2-oxoacid:ferredoxin oxidoreductase alpha subunit
MANSTVNNTNPNIDLTVRVFDDFYSYDVNVAANEYSLVHSYFLSVMPSQQAADNFTVSVFRLAEMTRIPVMTLLKEFQGQQGTALSVSLAYYLNNIRSRATLLGVGAPTSPNFYAARNVVQ